jgi:hypothetical protein
LPVPVAASCSAIFCHLVAIGFKSKTVRECTNRAEAINRLHTGCPKE